MKRKPTPAKPRKAPTPAVRVIVIRTSEKPRRRKRFYLF